MPRFELLANGQAYSIEGDRAVCAVAAFLTHSTLRDAHAASVADSNAVLKHQRADLVEALHSVTFNGDEPDSFERAAQQLARQLTVTYAGMARQAVSHV